MDAILSYFLDQLLQILPVFYGTEEENMYFHLQKYEKICQKIFDGNHRLLLLYFPYSLRDDAYFWFTALPINSFTWISFQAEFLKTYLLKARNQVLQQLSSATTDFELCSVRWRGLPSGLCKGFNQLQLDCRHDDFSADHLCQIFYTGLQPHTQDFVQSMSDGAFFSYSLEDSWYYLQDLAQHERTFPSSEQSLPYGDDGQCSHLFVEPCRADTQVDCMVRQEETDDRFNWSQDMAIPFPYLDDEGDVREGENEFVDVEIPDPLPLPELPLQRASIPPKALHPTNDSIIIVQGSFHFHQITPICSESQTLVPYYIDSDYCRPYILDTYSQFDDPVWHNFCPIAYDPMYFLQDTRQHVKGVCSVGSLLGHTD